MSTHTKRGQRDLVTRAIHTSAHRPAGSTRAARLIRQPLDGRQWTASATTDLPFTGDVQALLDAAARLYPQHQPTSYFLGQHATGPYRELVVDFGVDASDHRVEVHVAIHASDLAAVATYLFATMHPTSVIAVWQPARHRSGWTVH